MDITTLTRAELDSIARGINGTWYAATEEQMMSSQTREQLRDLAKKARVPLGKNKRETARNLVGSVFVQPALKFIAAAAPLREKQ